MLLPPAETTKWLALLAAAVLLTTFGTTFPNRFNQYRNPRSHNGVRLFNECLARCQLAFFNYFLAFGITAPLEHHPYVKYWLAAIVVAATYSYASNIAASVELGQRLKELHDCPGTATVTTSGDITTSVSQKCTHKIEPEEFMKLSIRYMVSTAILGGLAIYYAFVAGQ